MTSLLKPFQRLFTPKRTFVSGVFHYQSPQDDPRNYRLHLRIEPDGAGILIVNAATVLHLNSTAAEHARLFIENVYPDEAAQQISQRYEVTFKQARQDYMDFSERIRSLVEMPDLDPVTFLDFERSELHSRRLTAPFRIDCALTYRLPEGQVPDSAPLDRVERELSTQEWKTLLEKAWQVGIPHVIFTGGEPTLRPDLSDLIIHAESIGQVTGLISDGYKFTDRIYLDRLLQAGLDHLMFILHPENEESWQALENTLVEDLSVTVHRTLTVANAALANSDLQRLAELGVTKISLSEVDPELTPKLQSIRDQAAGLGLELVWDLPVPYSQLHPVALEAQDAQIQGGGRAWIYVEPDGDVRTTQGDPRILGNLLRDEWKKIWNP